MYVCMFMLSCVLAERSWDMPALKEDGYPFAFENQPGERCRINAPGTKLLFLPKLTKLYMRKDCPPSLPGYENSDKFYGFKEYLGVGKRNVVYVGSDDDDMIHVVFVFAAAFMNYNILVPCECLLIEENTALEIKALDRYFAGYAPGLKVIFDEVSALPSKCVGDMELRLKAEKESRIWESYVSLEGPNNVYNYLEMKIQAKRDTWLGTSSELMMNSAKELWDMTSSGYFTVADAVIDSCWLLDSKIKEASAKVVAHSDSQLAAVADKYKGLGPTEGKRAAKEEESSITRERDEALKPLKKEIVQEIGQEKKILLFKSDGTARKDIIPAHDAVKKFVQKTIDVLQTDSASAAAEWKKRADSAKDFIASAQRQTESAKAALLHSLKVIEGEELTDDQFRQHFWEKTFQIVSIHANYDDFCIYDSWAFFAKIFNEGTGKVDEGSRSLVSSIFRSSRPVDELRKIANVLKVGFIAAKDVKTCIDKKYLYTEELKALSKSLRSKDVVPPVSDLIEATRWISGVVYESIMSSDTKKAQAATLVSQQADKRYNELRAKLEAELRQRAKDADGAKTAEMQKALAEAQRALAQAKVSREVAASEAEYLKKTAECNWLRTYVYTVEMSLGSIATMEDDASGDKTRSSQKAVEVARAAFKPLTQTTKLTGLQALVTEGAGLATPLESATIAGKIRSMVTEYCGTFTDFFSEASTLTVPSGWAKVETILPGKCPLAEGDRVKYLSNEGGLLWGRSGNAKVVSVRIEGDAHKVTLYSINGDKEFACNVLSVPDDFRDKVIRDDNDRAYAVSRIEIARLQAEHVCKADDFAIVGKIVDAELKKLPDFSVTRIPADEITRIYSEGKLTIMKAIAFKCGLVNLEALLDGVDHLTEGIVQQYNEGIRATLKEPMDILIGKISKCKGRDRLRKLFDALATPKEFEAFVKDFTALKTQITTAVQSCNDGLLVGDRAALLVPKDYKMITGDCPVNAGNLVRIFDISWKQCTVRSVTSSGSQFVMGQTADSSVVCSIGGNTVTVPCSLVAVESAFDIGPVFKPENKLVEVQKLAASVDKICPALKLGEMRRIIQMAYEDIKNDVSKTEEIYRTKSVLQRLKIVNDISRLCGINFPTIEEVTDAAKSGASDAIARAAKFLNLSVVRIIFRKASNCKSGQPGCAIPQGWATQPGEICRISAAGTDAIFVKSTSKFVIHPSCPVDLPGGLKDGEFEGFKDFTQPGGQVVYKDSLDSDFFDVREDAIRSGRRFKVPCECLLIGNGEAERIADMDDLVTSSLPEFKTRFDDLKALVGECVGDQTIASQALLEYRLVVPLLSITDLRELPADAKSIAALKEKLFKTYRTMAAKVYHSCMAKEADTSFIDNTPIRDLGESTRNDVIQGMALIKPEVWSSRVTENAAFASSAKDSIFEKESEVVNALQAKIKFESDDYMQKFSENTLQVLEYFAKYDSCSTRKSLAELEAKSIAQPTASFFRFFGASKETKDLKWILEVLKVEVNAAKELIDCIKTQTTETAEGDGSGDLLLAEDLQEAAKSLSVPLEKQAVDVAFELSMRSIAAALKRAVSFTINKQAEEALKASVAATARLYHNRASSEAAAGGAKKLRAAFETIGDQEQIAEAAELVERTEAVAHSIAKMSENAEEAVSVATDQVLGDRQFAEKANQVMKASNGLNCPELKEALTAAEKNLETATGEKVSKLTEALVDKIAATSTQRLRFFGYAKKVKSKEAEKALISELGKEINKLCGGNRKHVMMAGAGAGIGFLGGAITAKLAGQSWSDAAKAGLTTAVAGGFAGGLGSWLKSKFGK